MGLLKIIKDIYDIRIARRKIKSLDETSRKEKSGIRIVSDVDQIQQYDPKLREIKRIAEKYHEKQSKKPEYRGRGCGCVAIVLTIVVVTVVLLVIFF